MRARRRTLEQRIAARRARVEDTQARRDAENAEYLAGLRRLYEMRLFAAPPEINGESFIPDTPARRARNTEILAGVSHRLGL